MENNPCEAILKHTFLRCKLQARKGEITCGRHKNFFGINWKYIFFRKVGSDANVTYSTKYYKDELVKTNGERVGHHIRKTLMEKRVELTDQDIRELSPNDPWSQEILLYFMEISPIDLKLNPRTLAICFKTIIGFCIEPHLLDLATERLKLIMTNPSMTFEEKLILVLNEIQLKYFFKSLHKKTTIQADPANYGVFFNLFFNYYRNEHINLILERQANIQEILTAIIYPRINTHRVE